MPGLERVICAGPPEGFVAWYERGALGYDADPIEDPAMVTYFVEGNQLVVAVHPSLLAVDPGAAPDGFVLYVGTARSINELDYFNGEGPLHVPEALVVPDDVVAQADQRVPEPRADPQAPPFPLREGRGWGGLGSSWRLGA